MLCSVVGCATERAVETPNATTTCTGEKCDAFASSALIKCWILPRADTDPFFQVDSLICQRNANALYNQGAVNVVTADSLTGGKFLADMPVGEAVEMMRFSHQRSYPLAVRIDLVSDAGNLPPWFPLSLRTETQLTSSAAAPVTAPYQLNLPFTRGELVVDAAMNGSLVFDYEVPLAPFTDARGNTTLRVARTSTLQRGLRTRLELAAPVGGGVLQGQLDAAPVAFPRFGHFLVNGTAVSPVAAPQGTAIANCQASETETDKIAIKCALAAGDVVRIANATAKVPGGAAVTLPPIAGAANGAAVLVAEVDPAELPFDIEIAGTFAAVDGTQFDPALLGKPVKATAQLKLADGEDAAARLPVDLWSLTITCAEELCFLDRSATLLPFTAEHSWAISLNDESVGDMGQNDTVTLIFASAAGTTSFAGKTSVLVGGDIKEQVATLQPGVYQLDRNGLVARP